MNQSTLTILKNNGFNIIHVNPLFSKQTFDRERWNIGKIFELFRILVQIINVLLFKQVDIVYYGLSSNKKAFIKDFVVLSFPMFLRKKVINHLHMSNLTEFYDKCNRIMKIMFAFTIAKTSLFIVLSENIKNKYQRIIPTSKLAVVENGVEPPTLVIDTKKANDNLVCLFLGILIKSKGYQIVMESAKLVRDTNIIFYIVGPPGNDFNEIENNKYIQRNGLEKNVHFLGAKYGKEKEKIFLQSDIFIFPTSFGPEAFPLVLLEAMSYGLCIISTSKGAIPEIVQEGHNGYLVETNNATQIANKIEFLNKNRNVLRKIFYNNLDTFNKKYSIFTYEEKIVHLFNNL